MTISLVVIIGLFLFLILYVFPTYSYVISGDSIYVKHKILKYVPFRSKKIIIKKIDTVRDFDFKKDIFSGGDIWGNLFIKRGVIIKCKKGFFKNIYVTPENPHQFIEQVREKMTTP
jgi:hypothetical protein